ncbi:NAB conserved region 2 (NCD2) [Popillia japonica]|uniref:NAB conserved region 2 (NCD2) n=1 Tax=Popillia japonica TaxID=7064 RepID=A0AAW1NLL1_POPJA
MESAASTSEEVRSSSTGPSSVSSATATNCNSGSSRHSPKIPVSIVPSPAASLLQRNTSSPSVPKKIMSKNHNNTVFPTTFPSNLAELQLYRVMQNASLLYYYDTLLEMGGDDVQQLCDAGEEEFLEIMSLVGMASKPLHVRRLQKSLQEWVTNPAKFKLPPVPGEDFEIELSSPRVSGSYYSLDCSDSNRSLYSPSPAESLPPVTSPGLSLNRRPYSPLDTTSCPPSSSSSPGNTGSLHVTPTLLESQISKLAAAAERLSKHLPQFEPKPHNAKKKMCKELELVMSMPETDPRRMDEIRRYAAIYGRFDCKRRPEKPLTLHEVSVNEAAAQICRFVPALLTRRDELFPLARQVVKDSGCHYSKIQYTSILIHKNSHQDREVLDMICSGRNSTRISLSDVDGLPTSKRQKMDGDGENEEQGLKRQDKAADDLITSRPHLNVLFHHSKSLQSRDSVGRSSSLVTDDETDSHFSYSNSSSPCQVSMQDQDSYGAENTCQGMLEEHQTDTDDSNKLSPKVQVIAASGDNIIAVANPALAMSPAILPLTLESREHSKMVDQ